MDHSPKHVLWWTRDCGPQQRKKARQVAAEKKKKKSKMMLEQQAQAQVDFLQQDSPFSLEDIRSFLDSMSPEERQEFERDSRE